jgi:hypothetical protein
LVEGDEPKPRVASVDVCVFDAWLTYSSPGKAAEADSVEPTWLDQSRVLRKVPRRATVRTAT